MKSLLRFAAITFAPLLLAAHCQTPPVDPSGTGGMPGVGGAPGYGGDAAVAGAAGASVDGMAACLAAAGKSEGVKAIARDQGLSLNMAAQQTCSSPALRDCFAEGRCK